MDAHQFDQLAKSVASGTRRGLLQFLAAFPLGGALATLPDTERDTVARRKKGHKHKKGRHRHKHKHKKPKGSCTPEPKTTTCQDACGTVQNNCQKPVNCGPCACNPPCPACATCDSDRNCQSCNPCCNDVCCTGATAVCHAVTGTCCDPDSHAQTCNGHCGDVTNNCGFTVDCGLCTCSPACPACLICDAESGNCVADPNQEGDACGEAGQFCQANGACACGASSCPACTTCGSNGFCADCTGCCSGGQCVASCGACQLCQSGQCATCVPCCAELCCAQTGAICHLDTGACCVPDSRATTCEGRCADVTNNCGQVEDCGPCTCGGSCPKCQTCDEETDACIADPVQVGKDCGELGQVCQRDGTCACEAGTCPACATCLGNGICSVPCAGEGCCDGTTCQPGTANTACGTGGNGCAICSGTTPICRNSVCVPCETNAECGTNSLCVAGVCQACHVTCAAADHTCGGGDLQAAISGGGTNGTVYVCPGRYNGRYSLNRNVTLIGAGDGDNPQVDTILDAQNIGIVVNIALNMTVELRRMRITGGNNYGFASGIVLGGGGFPGGFLTLRACTVTGNSATFDQLLYQTRGGGIFISDAYSHLFMTDCTVSANHTDNTAGDAVGGGIYNDGELVMTNCRVEGNTAITDGGGIYSTLTATLTDCEVTNNRLTRTRYLNPGSGTDNEPTKTGILTLNNSYVWDNFPPDTDCRGTITGSGCGEAPPP